VQEILWVVMLMKEVFGTSTFSTEGDTKATIGGNQHRDYTTLIGTGCGNTVLAIFIFISNLITVTQQ